MAEWPRGWWPIENLDHRRAFREELEAEVGAGHLLKGMALDAIARRDGSDDYLFAAEDGRVAEVRLTFGNHPERPPWPEAVLYESLEAWRRSRRGETQD